MNELPIKAGDALYYDLPVGGVGVVRVTTVGTKYYTATRTTGIFRRPIRIRKTDMWSVPDAGYEQNQIQFYRYRRDIDETKMRKELVSSILKNGKTEIQLLRLPTATLQAVADLLEPIKC